MEADLENIQLACATAWQELLGDSFSMAKDWTDKQVEEQLTKIAQSDSLRNFLTDPLGGIDPELKEALEEPFELYGGRALSGISEKSKDRIRAIERFYRFFAHAKSMAELLTAWIEHAFNLQEASTARIVEIYATVTVHFSRFIAGGLLGRRARPKDLNTFGQLDEDLLKGGYDDGLGASLVALVHAMHKVSDRSVGMKHEVEIFTLMQRDYDMIKALQQQAARIRAKAADALRAHVSALENDIRQKLGTVGVHIGRYIVTEEKKPVIQYGSLKLKYNRTAKDDDFLAPLKEAFPEYANQAWIKGLSFWTDLESGLGDISDLIVIEPVPRTLRTGISNLYELAKGAKIRKNFEDTSNLLVGNADFTASALRLWTGGHVSLGETLGAVVSPLVFRVPPYMLARDLFLIDNDGKARTFFSRLQRQLGALDLNGYEFKQLTIANIFFSIDEASSTTHPAILGWGAVTRKTQSFEDKKAILAELDDLAKDEEENPTTKTSKKLKKLGRKLEPVADDIELADDLILADEEEVDNVKPLDDESKEAAALKEELAAKEEEEEEEDDAMDLEAPSQSEEVRNGDFPDEGNLLPPAEFFEVDPAEEYYSFNQDVGNAPVYSDGELVFGDLDVWFQDTDVRARVARHGEEIETAVRNFLPAQFVLPRENNSKRVFLRNMAYLNLENEKALKVFIYSIFFGGNSTLITNPTAVTIMRRASRFFKHALIREFGRFRFQSMEADAWAAEEDQLRKKFDNTSFVAAATTTKGKKRFTPQNQSAKDDYYRDSDDDSEKATIPEFDILYEAGKEAWTAFQEVWNAAEPKLTPENVLERFINGVHKATHAQGPVPFNMLLQVTYSGANFHFYSKWLSSKFDLQVTNESSFKYKHASLLWSIITHLSAMRISNRTHFSKLVNRIKAVQFYDSPEMAKDRDAYLAHLKRTYQNLVERSKKVGRDLTNGQTEEQYIAAEPTLSNEAFLHRINQASAIELPTLNALRGFAKELAEIYRRFATMEFKQTGQTEMPLEVVYDGGLLTEETLSAARKEQRKFELGELNEEAEFSDLPGLRILVQVIALAKVLIQRKPDGKGPEQWKKWIENDAKLLRKLYGPNAFDKTRPEDAAKLKINNEQPGVAEFVELEDEEVEPKRGQKRGRGDKEEEEGEEMEEEGKKPMKRLQKKARTKSLFCNACLLFRAKFEVVHKDTLRSLGYSCMRDKCMDSFNHC